MKMFFQIEDNSIYNRSCPWASNLYAPSMPEPACPKCGAQHSHFQGTATAKIDRGSKWCDAVGSGSGRPSFMLSESVVQGLHAGGITGFREYPVQIKDIQSKKLRIVPPPNYFYLQVTGLIDVDLDASGIRCRRLCPLCFNASDRSAPRQFAPILETWDGCDFFTIRNYPSGYVFCSEKVLLLARQHRWTNLRFDRMDMVQRHSGRGWKGIDYLGKQWPPKWYPDPPSKGKSMEEWLDVIRTNPHEGHYAFDALLDFGQEALPPLLDMVRNGSNLERWNAGQVLWRFRRQEGVELSSDVKAAIRRAIPTLPPTLLD